MTQLKAHKNTRCSFSVPATQHGARRARTRRPSGKVQSLLQDQRKDIRATFLLDHMHTVCTCKVNVGECKAARTVFGTKTTSRDQRSRPTSASTASRQNARNNRCQQSMAKVAPTGWLESRALLLQGCVLLRHALWKPDNDVHPVQAASQ